MFLKRTKLFESITPASSSLIAQDPILRKQATPPTTARHLDTGPAIASRREALFDEGPDAGLGQEVEQGLETPKTKRRGQKKDGKVSWILALGLAGALVTGIRLWVADVFVMRSPAMDPTVEMGDRLLIDKLSHHWQSPERGEIIAFEPPKTLKEMRPQATQPFVLRIVGVPGDRLQILEGKLFLNGKAQPEPYLQEAATYDMAEVTIPEGTYFVLGDNRNDSFDSSIWGIVPEDKIMGRARSVVYPPEHLGGL